MFCFFKLLFLINYLKALKVGAVRKCLNLFNYIIFYTHVSFENLCNNFTDTTFNLLSTTLTVWTWFQITSRNIFDHAGLDSSIFFVSEIFIFSLFWANKYFLYCHWFLLMSGYKLFLHELILIYILFLFTQAYIYFFYTLASYNNQ